MEPIRGQCVEGATDYAALGFDDTLSVCIALENQHCLYIRVALDVWCCF